MSSVQNIQGENKYWFNGLPANSVVPNIGTLTYWFKGLPVQYLNNSRKPQFSTTYNVGMSVLLDQVN